MKVSPRYYLVDFEPPDRSVAVAEGTNLLEAARRAGIHLWSGCGGQGTCGQCCVIVTDGQVSEITEG
jgi:ferredoxin